MIGDYLTAAFLEQVKPGLSGWDVPKQTDGFGGFNVNSILGNQQDEQRILGTQKKTDTLGNIGYGLLDVPRKVAEVAADIQKIPYFGPIASVLLASTGAAGLTQSERASSLIRRAQDEGGADRNSIAFKVGEMAGNATLFALTAGVGGAIAGSALAGSAAAETIGTAALGTRLGGYLFEGLGGAELTAHALASAGAGMATTSLGNYEAVKSGQMGLGEFAAQAALSAPFAMVGNVGVKAFNAGVGLGNRLAFMGKNALAGSIAGAGQAASATALSDVIHDQSFSNVPGAALEGAVFGAAGGGLLSAFGRRNPLPDKIPDADITQEPPTGIAPTEAPTQPKAPQTVEKTLTHGEVADKFNKTYDILGQIDKMESAPEGNGRSDKFVKGVEDEYGVKRAQDEPINDWMQRVADKSAAEGETPELFGSRVMEIAKGVAPAKEAPIPTEEPIKGEPVQKPIEEPVPVEEPIKGEPVKPEEPIVPPEQIKPVEEPVKAEPRDIADVLTDITKDVDDLMYGGGREEVNKLPSDPDFMKKMDEARSILDAMPDGVRKEHYRKTLADIEEYISRPPKPVQEPKSYDPEEQIRKELNNPEKLNLPEHEFTGTKDNAGNHHYDDVYDLAKDLGLTETGYAPLFEWLKGKEVRGTVLGKAKGSVRGQYIMGWTGRYVKDQLPRGSNGYFEPEPSRSISVDRATPASTLVHEAIHAIIDLSGAKQKSEFRHELTRVRSEVTEAITNSLKKLKNLPEHPIMGLEEAARIRAELHMDPELAAHIRDQLHANPEELVAWVFSNKEFAQYLDTIPSDVLNPQGMTETLWGRIKRVVLSFIGKETGLSGTKLDEIMLIMDKYAGIDKGAEGEPWKFATVSDMLKDYGVTDAGTQYAAKYRKKGPDETAVEEWNRKVRAGQADDEANAGGTTVPPRPEDSPAAAKTIDEIAKQYGLTRKDVRDFLDSEGIPYPKRKLAELDPETIAKIADRFAGKEKTITDDDILPYYEDFQSRVDAGEDYDKVFSEIKGKVKKDLGDKYSEFFADKINRDALGIDTYGNHPDLGGGEPEESTTEGIATGPTEKPKYISQERPKENLTTRDLLTKAAKGVAERTELVKKLVDVRQTPYNSAEYKAKILELQKHASTLKGEARDALNQILDDRIQRDYIGNLANGLSEADILRGVEKDWRNEARRINRETGAPPGSFEHVTERAPIKGGALRDLPENWEKMSAEELSGVIGKTKEVAELIKKTAPNLYSDAFLFGPMKEIWKKYPQTRMMIGSAAARLGTEFMDDDETYFGHKGREWKRLADMGVLAGAAFAGGVSAYSKIAKWANPYSPLDVLTDAIKPNFWKKGGDTKASSALRIAAYVKKEMEGFAGTDAEREAMAAALTKRAREIMKSDRVSKAGDLTITEVENPDFAKFMTIRDKVVDPTSQRLNADMKDDWDAVHGKLGGQQVAAIKDGLERFNALQKGGATQDEARATVLKELGAKWGPGVTREFTKASKGEKWNVAPKPEDMERVALTVAKVRSDLDKIRTQVSKMYEGMKKDFIIAMDDYNKTGVANSMVKNIVDFINQTKLQAMKDDPILSLFPQLHKNGPISREEWEPVFDAWASDNLRERTADYVSRIRKNYFEDRPDLFDKYNEVRDAINFQSEKGIRLAQGKIIGMENPDPNQVPAAFNEFYHTYSKNKAEYDDLVKQAKVMDKNSDEYLAAKAQIKVMAASLRTMAGKIKAYSNLDNIRQMSPEIQYLNTELGHGRGEFVVRWGKTDEDPGSMKRFESARARASWLASPEGAQAREWLKATGTTLDTPVPKKMSEYWRRSDEDVENIVKMSEMIAGGDMPVDVKLQTIIDAVNSSPRTVREAFKEWMARAQEVKDRTTLIPRNKDKVLSDINGVVADGIAIWNGYGPTKHFMGRTGVKGWMPKTGQEALMFLDETHAMMQHEIADGYGKTALQNYYVKELRRVRELGLQPEYQKFLERKLDMTVSPRNMESSNALGWKVSNSVRSFLSSTLMGLPNFTAPVKNLIEGGGNASAELARLQSEINGSSPTFWSAPNIVDKVIKSHINNYSGDLKTVFDTLSGQHFWDAQFTKHTTQGNRSGERAMKILDKSLILQSWVESNNRMMSAMAAADVWLKAHKGDVEGALQVARRTTRRSQGYFTSDAMLTPEYILNSNPVTSMLMPLFAAAARATMHYMSFPVEFYRSPSAAALRPMMSAVATMVALGGAANVALTGDALNLLKGAQLLSAWVSGEDPQAILNESPQEDWKRTAQGWAKSLGVGEELGGLIYDNTMDGLVSTATGKNLQLGKTLTGMVPSVLVNRISDYARGVKGDATTEEKVMRWANILGGPGWQRFARVTMELDKGSYVDSKGGTLDRPYSSGDAIMELLLGRDLKDFKASERDYQKGGYMYGQMDVKKFVSRLEGIPGIKLNPRFNAYMIGDVKAANDFRYSMLRSAPGYADQAEHDKQRVEEWLASPNGQKFVALRSKSMGPDGQPLTQYGKAGGGEEKVKKEALSLIDKYYAAVTFLDASDNLRRAGYNDIPGVFHGASTAAEAKQFDRQMILGKWIVSQLRSEQSDVKHGLDYLPR